jgi:hypothetical protein
VIRSRPVVKLVPVIVPVEISRNVGMLPKEFLPGPLLDERRNIRCFGCSFTIFKHIGQKILKFVCRVNVVFPVWIDKVFSIDIKNDLTSITLPACRSGGIDGPLPLRSDSSACRRTPRDCRREVDLISDDCCIGPM